LSLVVIQHTLSHAYETVRMSQQASKDGRESAVCIDKNLALNANCEKV